MSAALLLRFMTDRLPQLDMAALDQRQEMTDVPGIRRFEPAIPLHRK
jgi:hypothetical protein